MKHFTYYIFIVLLCGFSFAAKAQYKGGSAEGFARNSFYSSVCSPLTNTSIYRGGSSEGFAYQPLITSVCTPILNTSIYFGGNSDGFAYKPLINSVCSPILNTSIYFGGNSDGFAYKPLINSVCAPQLNTSIYFGGNSDGFAFKPLINSVCAPQFNTSVYFGGNADGFAYKSLITTVCPPQLNTSVYFGGSTDGYSFGKVTTAGVGTWLGTTSSDWANTSNWFSNTLPTSSTNVYIPSGTPFSPIIGAAAAANTINISFGATLTISGTNTLTVSGTSACAAAWNNSGTFVANSSTVIFNGTAQTLNAGTSNTLFNNLTFSGSGLKIVSIATTTVNGVLSMEGTATMGGSSPVYGTNATLRYAGSSAQTTSNIEFPATFSGTGGVIINNTNGVTLNAAKTISSTLNISLGTLNMANTDLSVGSLTGTGNLTHSSGVAGARTLTIGSDNTSPAAYTGVISNGTATSTLVTKTGTGALSLGGNNTYSGITTISNGVIRLAASGGATNSPLGTTASGTRVLAGASLDLNGFTLGTAEPLTINGTGYSSGGAITNTSLTAASYSGLITLGSAATIAASNGDIAITNSGTISGATFTLGLDGTATGSSISSIIGNTTGGIEKNGSGTWTLSGVNTYTGPTNINAGSLKAGIATQAFGTTSAVIMANASGANLDITGFNNTIGSLTGGGTNGGNIILGAAILNIGSNNTSPASYDGVISGTGNIVKIGTGTLTLGGLSTYTGTTTILNGEVSIKTLQNVSGGASALGAPTTVGNGTINIASAAGAGVLTYTGAGNSSDRIINIANANGASINASGAGTFLLSGGVTGNTFNLTLGGTGNGSQSGVIATTTGTLTKTGAGVWNLSGANTYSGLTTINLGTLQLGANGGATNTPLGTITNGTVVSATNAALDLNGFSLATNEILTLNGTGISNNGALTNSSASNSTYSGLISLGSSSLIAAPSTGNIIVANTGTIVGATFGLTLGGTATACSLASIIGTTSGSLTKSGTGAWTVSGLNTFTGLTNVSAGTLKLGIAGGPTNTPLGTTASGTTVSSGATLDLNGFTLGTLEALTINGSGASANGALSNGSSTSVNYNGLITLGSASTISAPSTGNISITNSGTITGATFTLTLDGTAAACSMASNIGNTSGGVTKNGTGRWTFIEQSTYTGLTTINDGTLQLNRTGGTTIPATNSVNIAGGTFRISTTPQTLAAQAAASVILGAPATFTIDNGVNFTIGDNGTFTHQGGTITPTTGTFAYTTNNTTVNYNNTTTNLTTGVEFPAGGTYPTNLSMNASGFRVNLSGARSLPINGVLSLTSGILNLGSNDLTINNTATTAINVVGSGSANNMVAADGAGQLKWSIPAAAGVYFYPIGDITGTPEYSPMQIAFSSNSTARVLGFRLVNGINPNVNTIINPSIDYLKRTWYSTLSETSGSYSYTPTLYYTNADIFGTEVNMLVSNWTGSLWSTRASTVTYLPNYFKTNADVNQTSLPLDGGEITGRAPIKYWTGATSTDWYTASNWIPSVVPSSGDNIDISFSNPNPCILSSGSVTINNFTLKDLGSFTVSSGVSFTVTGNLTYVNSAVANFSCGSTLTLSNSVYPQTIPSTNASTPTFMQYGSLNIAGGARVLDNTGTIKICNNYTSTAGTLTTSGSTVEFNGTSAQVINTNPARFHNLLISNPSANVTSNVAVTVASGGTLSILGNATNTRLDMGTNTLTLTGATASITTGILRTGGTITGGTRTFDTNGTYEHNYTSTAGTIPASTWSTGSTCSIIGYTTNTSAPTGLGQTFSNFTWNCAAQTGTINLGSALTTVNKDFTVSSTSVGSLALASANLTMNVGGNMNLNGGSLLLNSGNNAQTTINLTGNFSQTAGQLNMYSGTGTAAAEILLQGNYSRTGNGVIAASGLGTANGLFTFNGINQTLTETSSGTNQRIDYKINAGSTTKLLSNLAVFGSSATYTGKVTVNAGGALDCGTSVISTAAGASNTAVIISSGSKIMTANAAGLASAGATGSVQTITRTFSSLADYEFNGATAQITGVFTTTPTAATVNTLKINNTAAAPAGVTLTNATTVAGALDLTAGLLILGTNNLTISNNTTSGIVNGSASSFVVTNNSGQLIRAINTGANTYNFPIGDITGAAEYSPVSIAFSSNSIARNLGFSVTDANHPQLNVPNLQVDYLSRYWSSSLSVTSGTYTYTPTFTYDVAGDVFGVEGNININRYNGSSWTEYSSAPVSPSISSSSITEITGSLASTSEWTGRINVGAYTWNGSTSSSFTTGTNWTPNIAGGPLPIDNVIINVPGTNQLDLGSSSVAVNNFTLNGTGVLNISSTGNITVNGNITIGGSAIANLNSNSTFTIASANSQVVPPINYGNLNLGTGTRILSSTGTIGISGTYTPTTGALTTTGSTISFNGAVQNIPSATFNNLTVAGTGDKILTGNITINGDLSVNANNLNLSNFTANRATVGGTLSIVNGSTLFIGGTNSLPSNFASHALGCTSTVEYNGTNQTVGNLNPSQSYGNLVLSGSGIKTLQVGTTSICNDFTTSGTCSTTGVVGITIGRDINIGAGTTFIAGAFTHNVGGNFNRNGTFTATGSTIQFYGSSNQQIINATTFENLTLNNPSGLTLNNTTTVSSVLDLLSGNLTLGTNNLIITNTASGAITGSFSNSNMIITDNTGQLIRATVTGNSYTYPIGDATGTLDYSPVSINFSAKSAASNIGFRVVDAVHPSMDNVTTQTDYISRYWISSNSSTPTYTYTATFDYVTSDINGSVSNISVNKWDGSIWTQAILSTSASNQLSLVTPENQTRMSFSSTAEFTGRVKPGEIYTWNQTGIADYTVPTNWTPTRIAPMSNDVLQFNNAATTTATNVPTEAIAQMFVTNNTNVSLTSTAPSTLSIMNGNGTDFQVSAGSTLNIASANGLTIQFTNTCVADLSGSLSLTGSNSNTFNTANSITTVTGAINNFGVVIGSTTSLLFNAASTYNHNWTNASGTIPLATWDATSNTNITSYTTGGGADFTPSNLNQSFGNFSWNCPLQSNDAQLNGALTTIAGNLNIVNTNNSILRLTNNATVSINVGGNFSNSGNTNLSSGSGANVVMNIAGSYNQSAGTYCLAESGLTSTATMNVAGDFNFSAGTISQTASPTNGNIALIELNGTVAQNVNSLGNYTGSINFRLNNASGATVTGTLQVNENATFYLTNGTLSGTGVCSYNATSSNLVYEGTTSLTTSDVEWPISNTPLTVTINNSSSVSLNSNKQIGAAAVLTETTGLLKLGAFDLTVENTSTSAIVNAFPSVSNMIVTDGVGKLKRGIAAGANTYLYPLGDIVGTIQYTPVSINFSANSTSRIVGFRVKDSVSANINIPNTPIDFLSRTWYSSENGSGGTYSYTPTLTYDAADDLNGSSANSIFANWDGAGWVVFPTSLAASSILTASDLTEAAGSIPLTNAELTSRSPIIYWIGGTSTDWNTASNWSSSSVPTSVDNIVISNLALNDCELSGTGAAKHFTLNGTRTFHAASTATLSIYGNVNYSNPAGFTFDCSSTLNLLSTVDNQFVPATSYGNLNLGTGTRTLDSSDVINICNNFTNTSGTLNVTNSTLNFNGTTAQNIIGAGSFFNLKVNNSAGVSITGNINVSDTLNLTNGNITIGNNNLTLAATGLVLNSSSNSYVKTNGNGRLKQTVSNVSKTFHVGNAAYNPITLTNNGTTDVYGVKLVDGSVGTEVNNTKIVNRYWDVTEALAGGSNLDVTAQWNAPVAQTGEEASGFVRNDIYKFVGLYDGSTWKTKNATLSGSDPYTYSGLGFTSVGKFELGSSDAFKSFFFTAANGNWNVGGTWVGGVSPSLNAGIIFINHDVTVTATPPAINDLVIGIGSIQINANQNVELNADGTLSNNHTAAVNITGAGSLIALGALTIDASTNPINIDNLRLSGASSINGDLHINSSLFMETTASILSGVPIYNSGSTLIYDVSSTTFSRGNEWSHNGFGTTGTTPGYPYHVTLRNVTGGFVGNTFNPGANSGSALSLACEGNLTLESWTYFNMNIGGSEMTAPLRVKGNITLGTVATGGRLTASSLSGGDVYCGGNFECANAGSLLSFVSNGRTLFMDGTSNQNFFDNNGLNPLSKLVIDKTSGDIKIVDFCAINGFSGDVLQIINNGGLDLNGKGINLTGNGGNILVSGGSRNIINSSVTACNLNVSGSKTVTSTSSGTLNIGNNIRVALTSAIDFGSSLTTIDGTLAMLPSGAVNNNAPIYSNTSTLEYTTGSTFSRGIEWSSTSGAGYPNHVNITANVTGTTLNLGTGTASPTIAGALTIAAACTVSMQAMASPLTVNGNIALTGVTAALHLSSIAGGNLLCGGNLSVGGATITHNSREVEMMGTSGIQDITGIGSFDNLKINNSGTSVRLNAASTTINNSLWLNNGTLDLNANALNIANNALIRRSASTSSMTAAPSAIGVYDLQYDATMNMDAEFIASTTAIRNLEITAGTLSMTANRTINNNLILSGGDLNLGTTTFTTHGNATAPAFAGSISISGGGTRSITGAGNFNITGAGGNNPTKYTKQFTSSGATTLAIAAGVTVSIGDGQVDFGAGNPVTINGTLQVLTAGSVGATLNACNYGTGSTLLFDNGVDYTISSIDKTWNSGSSGAGVPYNVTINSPSTDVYLNADRTIRNNLDILDAQLHTGTLTNGISIKGSWTRAGASSAFENATNAKVTFNGTSSQAINLGVGVSNETFYDLTINNAAGVTLGTNTDLIIANELNLNSGVLDIGSPTNTIVIDGNTSGASSSSYINTDYVGAGNVRRKVTNNGAYTFPIGDANNYSPITITLSTGAQAGAYLKAKAIDAVHPTASFGSNYLSRYWILDETGLASNFSYNVEFVYNDADVNGSESMIYPYKLHPGTGQGSGWLGPYGSDASFPFGGYTQDATNNIFTWNGLINFSDLTGGGGGTPQPITLLYFDVKANNEQVDVTWSTASEINNDYFEVQRSENGKDFESIDKIAGAGNHNGVLNYSSIDENPNNGISYYRLKQVDFDGTASYSNIKYVEINKANETLPFSIELYPNPSNGKDVKLSMNGITAKNLVQVKLFSSNGSKVFSKNWSGANGSKVILIPTENLSNGIYYLQINVDGTISNMKVFVVNN